jgi:hypothetical protein
VTFLLPDALNDPNDDTEALDLLRRYYGDPFCGPGSAVGAAFDQWDSTGTRAADSDRFTADDLVAVTFLSVEVSAPAARTLLGDRAEEFSKLLAAVGPDRDLANETEPLLDFTSAGWALMTALRTLPKVGPTKASKLFARKRPGFRPIWDRVVSRVTNTVDSQWEPMRIALRADDLALQSRLLRLRQVAELPEEVSALRVLDVIAWREGKDKGL